MSESIAIAKHLVSFAFFFSLCLTFDFLLSSLWKTSGGFAGFMGSLGLFSDERIDAAVNRSSGIDDVDVVIFAVVGISTETGPDDHDKIIVG